MPSPRSLLAVLVVVLCVSSLVSASNVRTSLKESWRKLPVGWAVKERAQPQSLLTLHVFVKQQNLKALEELLYAVSDPRSSQYGQHLSLEQVSRLVAPSAQALKAVYNWLQSAGVKLEDIEAVPGGDVLQVEVPVAVAEKLLHAEYFVFEHRTSRRQVTRTSSYSLPVEVAPFVDFVGPTVRFPTIKERPIRSNKGPDAAVTPTFLRNLYGVGTTVNSSPGNRQGIASFLEQYYNPSDLQKFFAKLYPAGKGVNITVIGPNDATNPGVEAMLDIEYIMAMGGGVPTQFWYTAGRAPNPENEPFLQWMYNVGNDTNAPYVFSISYGDNEDTVGLDYANRVSVEFQKAGVRGISLMASSGDGGVGGSQPTSCTTFIANFPASSPYITAVGGSTSSNPEVAASLSSGGFSDYFPITSYQSSYVQHYFQVAKNLPPSNRYNHSGIGFPDVAAQAENFDVFVGGFEEPVAGTSCSSPTFTGIVSLLNDIRFQAGKSSLGWLNPLFYQNPNAFNDVTSGNNPGCSSNGFYAAEGWDPVTGLGTPNFPKLADVVKNLP